MGLGPFDLMGGPFLTLYAGLFAAAFVAGIVIPRWLRPEGRPGAVTQVDQLAYLAGGAIRFGEALTARLLSAGALVIHSGTIAIRSTTSGATSAERSVLALPSPVKWGQLAFAIRQDAEALDAALVQRGLLIDRASGLALRFWQTAPYLVLLPFGAIKWEVGTMRDRPVGYLTAFLVATAVFALIRFAALDRRTRAGIAALQDAKLQSARLRRAPTTEEAGLAVALFGTGVLAGSSLSELHSLRSSSSSDSGSGSSSSDGGSGCGGGGCGGCGG